MLGWGGGAGGELTTGSPLWQGAGDTHVPICKGENGRKSDTSMKSKSFPNRCVLWALIIQEPQPTCALSRAGEQGEQKSLFLLPLVKHHFSDFHLMSSP